MVRHDIACEVARLQKVVVTARRQTGAFALETLETALQWPCCRPGWYFSIAVLLPGGFIRFGTCLRWPWMPAFAE